jgi:hypothetical protein
MQYTPHPLRICCPFIDVHGFVCATLVLSRLGRKKFEWGGDCQGSTFKSEVNVLIKEEKGVLKGGTRGCWGLLITGANSSRCSLQKESTTHSLDQEEQSNNRMTG